MIDNIVIREIALQHGFKLEKQKNGEYDLNCSIYGFARSLINETKHPVVRYRRKHVFPDSFTDEMRRQAEGLKDCDVIVIDSKGRTPSNVKQAMTNALGHRRFKLKQKDGVLYMRYYYDYE